VVHIYKLPAIAKQKSTTRTMNLIKIFIIFFIVAFASLHAQINIEATTSFSGQKFKIEISESPEKYFISLKILDIIQTNKQFEDEMEKYRGEYFALTNTSVKNDSVKSIINRMKILTEKKSLYSLFITEIVKTDYKKFDNLIKLFNKKNAEFFKRMENKNRIVFDGTLVKINVGINENNKAIWAQSPREKSHPEINTLITSTLEIFRSRNLLSNEKMITSGY
jgi:hypothetical protein